MTEFEGVVPALAQALNKRGYAELTPVQKAVIAPEMADADALVSAQTGSGKTVAFGMALAPTLLGGADRFGPAGAPVGLAVAPTRELALQVKRELEWLYELTGASVASCVGGMDMRDERRVLERGAHIVVGTPGRLRDHIERGSLDTSALKAVVLDEADEMLDLGFRDDLEYILDAAPAERRTLMFSATVPHAISTLAKRYQRDAVRIATATGQKQHLDIEYRALTVAPNDRENAIINLLRYFDAKSAIVFCGTRATVNHMTSRFNNRGFSVVALSGELSQNERTHALQAMRDGRARVCIATDVAARGIDLPDLELVIHADLPKTAEALLHRSGRTGRAGRKGVSALIVPHNARRRTERLLSSAQIEATWAKPPSVDDIMQRDRERILDDPAFAEPASGDDLAFARELLARHGAEAVACAFVRRQRADIPAPEELLDTGPAEPEPARRSRDDFKGGVWFSLTVGRKDNAEARWLLPMLCRAGHITKGDIGAIRIHQNETHVELTAASVERFLDAIGPSRKVEKTIAVTRLDGVPTPPSEGRDQARPPVSPYAKKRPFTGGKSGGFDKTGPKRPYTPKGDAQAGEDKRPGTPSRGEGRDKGHDKPWTKSAPKSKDKKPFSKGMEKPARPAKAGKPNTDPSKRGKFAAAPAKPGSAPLKRKTPHRKGEGGETR